MAKKKRDSRGFTGRATKDDGPKIIKPGPPQSSNRALYLVSLKLVRKYALLIGVIIVIPGLLAQLGNLMAGNATKYTSGDPVVLFGVPLRSLSAIWSLLGIAAIYYATLRIIGGNPPKIWESYRNSFRYIPRLFLTTIAFAAVVIVGLCLLVIPGLIWMRRYFFAPYFAIDDDMGVREAMSASARATKQVRPEIWRMFGLFIVLLAISAALTRFVPIVGGSLAVLFGATYVFLPVLRYQEMTSEVRRGAWALDPGSRHQGDDTDG